MWDCVTGALKPENVSLNVMVRAFRSRLRSSVAVPGEKIAPVSAAVGPGRGPVSSNPEYVVWNSVASAYAPGIVSGAAKNIAKASLLRGMTSALSAGWISP